MKRILKLSHWFILLVSVLFLCFFSVCGTGEEKPVIAKIQITSTAFELNGNIPATYTCEGENINPPLAIEGVPAEAKSLALIMDDPDARKETWVHWVVWNIDPGTTEIAENSTPTGSIVGVNDFKRNDYGGPCPPTGTHRYFFKIYALDTVLDLAPTSKKADLEKAMKGHIIAQGELVGLYVKQNK